jgi:hypothetical protein
LPFFNASFDRFRGQEIAEMPLHAAPVEIASKQIRAAGAALVNQHNVSCARTCVKVRAKNFALSVAACPVRQQKRRAGPAHALHRGRKAPRS